MSIIKPNNNTISAITALPAAITTGKILQIVSSENAYTSGGSAHSGISMNVLDSPSTTSATSYTMYFRATAAHSQTLQNAGAKSTIILLEIAG